MSQVTRHQKIKMQKVNDLIPQLGFGTFQITDNCSDLVTFAIEKGYRHIDTAQFYKNEKEVGQGIKNASISRDEIFLTTKVWPDNLSKAAFLPSVEESLQKLDADYIDLLLIHWPSSKVDLKESLTELMKAQEKGYAKHIGVSNFNTQLLQQVLDFGAPIINNQVEYHPFLDQDKLIQFHQEKNLSLTSYCPLARGKIVENEIVKVIAEKHRKTGGQVCLRWHIQQEGVIPIPKSSTPSRIEENIAVFDFELSEEEMQQISALKKADGRLISPAGIDWD